MKINSLKTLTSLAVAMAFLLAGSAFGDEVKTKSKNQNNSKFFIRTGRSHEICREVKKILDEPENKNFGEPYITNSEFVIPEKYTDFELPVWQDVSMEELPKYMASEWMNKIKEYNEKYKSEGAKVLIQRTEIDLDGDGKEEDVLQFKATNPKRGVRGTLGPQVWHCFVSDVIPSVISKNHNDLNNGIASECVLLKYKNKAFRAENSSFDNLQILKPITGTGVDFGFLNICNIDFTPSKQKKARKALKEHMKKLDKQKTKLSTNNNI